VAQDYFTSVVVEKEVGPTFTLMNLGAGGKSLAIGMLSSNMGTYQNALPTECFHLTTASGSNGFLKVLQLKVTATKWNYTGISFMFHKGAGNALFTRATIIVNGGDTTDPTPQIVLSSNPGIDPIYIQKSAANTWDVYIAKVGGEQVGLYDLNVYRPNLITVSTQNQWVASVPAGYITSKWEHLDTVYPVGSVKLTWDAVNPGTRLGGTWVQFSQGRVLIGQGTGNDGSTSMTFGAQDTGGEYKHRLTESELPTHSHWLTGDTNHTGHSFAWGGAGKNVYLNVLAAGGNGTGNVANTVQNEWNHTAVTGGNALHNNVQPYQVIYAWRRTG
ncbi:phage baseplate protein, partial [Faecalibaculum rodentium]